MGIVFVIHYFAHNSETETPILLISFSVYTLTLVTDVVESSLISQNVGIENAEKWFKDELDRSYRFGVMSKNVNYNNNSHTKWGNFK